MHNHSSCLLSDHGVLPVEDRGGAAGLQGYDWCSDRASVMLILVFSLLDCVAAAEEYSQRSLPRDEARCPKS